MQELCVAGQQLNGSLPVPYTTLTNLQQLDLSRNSLKGPLPESWVGMSELRYLNLSADVLTGSVPTAWKTTWSKPGTDIVVDLCNNGLTGANVFCKP